MTLLIILLLFIGLIIGYRRGGILQILHFLGTMSAIVIARLNYETLGSHLDLIMPYPSSALEVENTVLGSIQDLESAYYYMSAFLIIFIVSKIFIQFIISGFDYLQQISFNRTVSLIVGVIFGLLEILYILAILIFFSATVPFTPLQEMIADSGLATFIMDHTFIISDYLKEWVQI